MPTVDTILMNYTDLDRSSIKGTIFPINDADSVILGTKNNSCITLKEYLTPQESNIIINTGGTSVNIKVLKIGNKVYTEGVSGTSVSGLNASFGTQLSPIYNYNTFVKIGGVMSPLTVTINGALSCNGTGEFTIPSMEWIINDSLDLNKITLPAQDEDVKIIEIPYSIEYYKDNTLVFTKNTKTFNLGTGLYISDIQDPDTEYEDQFLGFKFDKSEPMYDSNGIIPFPNNNDVIKIYYITDPDYVPEENI